MKRLLWFRRDLRVEDNRLFTFEGEVLPIFIFDSAILETLEKSDRRVGMIFERVIWLKEQLRGRGLDLALFVGEPERVIAHLQKRFGFDEVVASGDYDGYARERDRRVSHLLPFRFVHDTYIFRPDEILKSDGSPYLVFTPFYKRAKALFTPEHLKACKVLPQQLLSYEYERFCRITEEGAQPLPLTIEALGFCEASQPFRLEPEARLEAFASKVADYEKRRDYPSEEATSQLSADLRFGSLSVRTLLRWLLSRKAEGVDTEPFFRQLIFRDFYAYLLFHFPHLEWENFRYPFHGVEDRERFETFCRAQTGVPIVDAGVRQLLETGVMHNRIRMVCASFFTKDLLLPWQWGEAFFARHLLDYDAASNVLSWQWSSGTGVDPQPYFRIFNPYRQSERFDAEGTYIKRWLPMLQGLTSRQLHDEAFLMESNIQGYPKPMIRHKEAAGEAQAYFKQALGKA